MGGVEAFFVISSYFLVKKHLIKEAVQEAVHNALNLKLQFKHRITRLYPQYCAVLLLAILYALLKKLIPYDLLTHALFLQNMQWIFTAYSSPMQPMTAHTWTLSIEVWAGLFFLILLTTLREELLKSTMFVMLAIGIIYRIVTIAYFGDVFLTSLCPLAHFDAFACGSLLAIGFKENKINKSIMGVLAFVGLTGIVMCILILSDKNQVSFVEGYKLLSNSRNYLNDIFTGNIYFFISLFATGVVGFCCLYDDKINTQLQEQTRNYKNIKKLFVTCGNNSYALYLFHWPILVVIKHFCRNWIILFSLGLIFSTIAVVLYTIFYEAIITKFGGIET